MTTSHDARVPNISPGIPIPAPPSDNEIIQAHSDHYPSDNDTKQINEMGRLHGSRVFVSPNSFCYLKFRGYQGGGVWWVPLFGPLNPSNLSFGCGFFDKVRRVTPTLSPEQGDS